MEDLIAPAPAGSTRETDPVCAVLCAAARALPDLPMLIRPRLDAELVAQLNAAQCPVVVYAGPASVLDANEVGRLMASGRVARWVVDLLPDECGCVSGGRLWAALRGGYFFLPVLRELLPAAAAARGRADGVIMVVDDRRPESAAVLGLPDWRVIATAFEGLLPTEVALAPVEDEATWRRIAERCGRRRVGVVVSSDPAWGARGAAVVQAAGAVVCRIQQMESPLRAILSGGEVSDGRTEPETGALRTLLKPIVLALADRSCTAPPMTELPDALGWMRALQADLLGIGLDEWPLVLSRRSRNGEAGWLTMTTAFVRLCDGCLHGWRLSMARALALAGEPNLAIELALGRAAEAGRLWDAAGRAERQAGLWGGLRAWMCVADGSQVARWREVSPAWRARLAEVTAAEPTDLSWRQLGILDSLLLGEEEAALERVRLAVDDGLGRNQVAAAALIAWQSGQEATASRIWTANQTLPVNGGVEDCFPQAVAQALIARDPAAGALLAAIESNSPEFFAPALPSHTRCGFAALAWASLGDAGRAVGWWRRALVEDPVAAARTAAWIRACRQGGVES